MIIYYAALPAAFYMIIGLQPPVMPAVEAVEKAT
jgi:hypothetical protein